MVSAIAAQGHYIYAGIGPELAVLDISIPERPTRVGYVVLPGLVKDIVALGDYAYVVDGNVHIIDISDPRSPRRTGFLDMYDRSDDIAVSVRPTASGKTYVYISDGTPDRLDCDSPTTGDAECQGRMHVVDVSDAAAPLEAGGYDISADVLDIAVAGDIAYVAGSEGLWVIDVSDPAAPTQVGLYDTAERVIGVEVKGSYAYAVVEGTGLRVLDVSDPAYPAQVGSHEFSTVCFGSPFENYHTLIARDTMYLLGCFAGGRGQPLLGVRILDISDPASPSGAGSYEMPSDRGEADNAVTTGMAVVDPAFVAGNKSENASDYSGRVYAYIGNRSAVSGRIGWTNGGIRVVDVSDPAHPVKVGGYDAPGSVWDVGVMDRPAEGSAYACTAAYGRGLQVVDVSDPTDPRQVGARGISEATDVLVTGSHAYVADQFCYFAWACNGRLRIIDFSDPAAPAEIGVYDPPGGFRYLVLAGDYIYAFNEDKRLDDGGVALVPLSNSGGQLLSLASLAAKERQHPGILAPRKALVAYRSLTDGKTPSNAASVDEAPSIYTLRIVDVSTPAAPVERVSHDLQRLSAWNLGVTRSYLYFATIDYYGDSCEELFVLDLSDPTRLSRVCLSDILGDETGLTSTPTPLAPDLEAHGEYAYISRDGYHVIDISNPAAPVKVGYSRVDGRGRRDAMNARYVYRSDHQGLWVVDVAEPTNPTIAGSYLMPWYPNALDLGYTDSSGPERPLIYVADDLGGLYILRFTPPVE